MEECRAARVDDVTRMAQLARMAIDELAPTRGGAVWKAREARSEPIEAGLERQLEEPDCRVVVGTIDGTVVGYAVTRIEHLGDGTHLGVVDDIFVETGARGVGVGESMIDDVIAWCREAGCIGIDAMALPGHRETKNFFEEAGFTARKLVMHHRMVSSDEPMVSSGEPVADRTAESSS